MNVLVNSTETTWLFKDIGICGLFVLKSNRKVYLKVSKSYVVDMVDQELCCDTIGEDEECLIIKDAKLSITI